MTQASTRGRDLYAQARRRIPGGTQLLSKRPEMFLPDQWPSYYARAHGVEIWDLDGHRYVDMSYSGIGACILGYADPDVNAAVHAAVDAGSASTLNCPEEVELADVLCALHPWADMVRFARSGGEAMAMSARIARASTRRDTIAFCGYHGWYDWYLAANLASDSALDGHLLSGLEPRGVPRGLLGSALPFHYNRLEELATIVETHGERLAAIVMEPIRSSPPQAGFLEGVRRYADATGAVLIFDEITAGFRLNTGGAHLLYEVAPDIAVFAKAMSNGYPMSAIIGRERVMQAAQATFMSSTNWTERIGPASALATIHKYQDRNVAAHLAAIGAAVQQGWQEAAQNAGLRIHVTGMAPLGHFDLEYPNSQAMRTLFTQYMLDKGFLATNAFYASFAHQPSHVDEYMVAVRAAFALLADADHSGTVEAHLRGPVAHSGFERLT